MKGNSEEACRDMGGRAERERVIWGEGELYGEGNREREREGMVDGDRNEGECLFEEGMRGRG